MSNDSPHGIKVVTIAGCMNSIKLYSQTSSVECLIIITYHSFIYLLCSSTDEQGFLPEQLSREEYFRITDRRGASVLLYNSRGPIGELGPGSHLLHVLI